MQLTPLARHIALAAILLIAAALRLNHVRQPYVDAFSWRQASTAMMADNYYRTSRNIFYPEVSWTGPGPNYQGREFQTVTYLAATLYSVLGQKDWIGRVISITFSLWGVFALYQVTRRAWGEPHALATSLIYAVLPGAIFIDRSFLPDPAMLALTTTTVWVYLAYLQTGRRGYLVAAGVVGTWAFLTKLPGIIALAPMGYATVTVLRARGELHWRSLRPIVGTLALAMIPIVAYYAWAVYLGTHYPPYHVAGASNWIWKSGLNGYLHEWFYLRDTASDLRGWLWTPPVLLLVAVGLLVPPPGRARRRGSAGRDSDARDVDRSPDLPTDRTDLRTPWLFHFWLLGCMVLYIAGARELAENPWNFHVFNVAAAGLAGHALVVLASLFRRAEFAVAWRWAVVGIVLAVLLLRGRQALALMYRPHAENTYRMGLALREYTKPGELVVTIADDVGDPIGIYYSRRRGWVYPPAHRQELWKPWNLIPADPEVSIELFDDLRERGAHWLGIVTRPLDDTPGRRNFWLHHPELVAHIDRTCEFVEKAPGFVIYRFNPTAQPATQPATDLR